MAKKPNRSKPMTSKQATAQEVVAGPEAAQEVVPEPVAEVTDFPAPASDDSAVTVTESTAVPSNISSGLRNKREPEVVELENGTKVTHF